MEIKQGSKVTQGKGKSLWTVLEVNEFSQVAKITNGKRTTMQYLVRLTLRLD